MQRSSDRILTTHTGSLPRPRELTRLYALRARGEAVDAAEIDRAGREAVRAVVRKQREAGIDVGNNGEQQRDSFFLYLQGAAVRARRQLGAAVARRRRRAIRNSSGCGPSSTPARPRSRRSAGCRRRSARCAISTIGAIDDECRHFKAVLDETPGAFVEPFMSAPSPGIVAHGGAQRALRHARGLSRGARPRAAGRIRGDRAARLSAADRCARPRARAPHHLQGPAGVGVRRLRRAGGRDHQPGARRTCRAIACACTSAGAIPNRRTTATCRSRTSCRPCSRPRSAASCCRSPIRATRTSSAASQNIPLADDQVLVAGVIDSLTNFVEHPEVVADRIERVARRGRRSDARAGRHRLRLRHLGRLGPRRRGRGLGQAREPARRRPPGVKAVVPVGARSPAPFAFA